MMREIYADHAATTAPAAEVVEAMRPYLSAEAFGNASSVHRRGEAAREAIEEARGKVASLIGALPEEIVFTASGSEANNLGLKGTLLGATPERRRLVVSAIEHPSVLETARHLESRGFSLSIVPVESNGLVSLARLAEMMGSDVALVSIQWVNNEVGAIQPIAEIARIAHASGARVHCDAVQAAGKLPIDVKHADVDLLSIAGHKFHGPFGAAALFVRRRTRLIPLIHGGHQERGRRAGTENLSAIVGFGVAAERALRLLSSGHAARVAALGDHLCAGLLSGIPGSRLNGDSNRLRSIVNVSVAGIDGEAVLHELDREGITVSTGSACSASNPGPSHVLLAMGLRPEDAHASVRFSLGEETQEIDVETILEVVPPLIQRLRTLAGPSGRAMTLPPLADVHPHSRDAVHAREGGSP
jgi:cysteine desulfurase